MGMTAHTQHQPSSTGTHIHTPFLSTALERGSAFSTPATCSAKHFLFRRHSHTLSYTLAHNQEQLWIHAQAIWRPIPQASVICTRLFTKPQISQQKFSPWVSFKVSEAKLPALTGNRVLRILRTYSHKLVFRTKPFSSLELHSWDLQEILIDSFRALSQRFRANQRIHHCAT